jgi:small-conductance mechanosensitive channel
MQGTESAPSLTAPALDLAELLKEEFMGNSVSNILTALAVLIGGTLVLGIAKRVIQARLGKIAERTDTQLDDLLVDLIRRTSRLFLFGLALQASLRFLVVHDALKPYLQNSITLIGWFQAGLWCRGLVHFGIQHMVRSKAENDPARAMGASVLNFLGQVLVWSVVVVAALANLGHDVTPLVTSLGVGGIAIALAAQNILGDLFASITLLLDKPFVVGDSIVLGDFQGTVEHIGVKTTRLRSVTGEQIVIGNHDLVSSRLRNFKRLVERRNLFTLGVSYTTPYEKVAAIPKIIEEIVRGTPDARFDRAHFKAFGDSALMYEVVYFVPKPDYNSYMDVQQKVNLEIHRRFAQEGIDLAFPTQVVHLVRPVSKKETAAIASNAAPAAQANASAPTKK